MKINSETTSKDNMLFALERPEIKKKSGDIPE